MFVFPLLLFPKKDKKNKKKRKDDKRHTYTSILLN
jgi:hypothetical protein